MEDTNESVLHAIEHIEHSEFTALGKDIKQYHGLDTFPRPELVNKIVLTSDEVTAVCPVTGQPDWYTVLITAYPNELCIESKSLKLYLQTFRNKGIFAEALAGEIAQDIADAIQPVSVQVLIIQKPRGGISILARAQWAQLFEANDNE